MTSVLSYFFFLLFSSMVGPTVDQRAEPVPKIHSIETHPRLYEGREL